MQGTNVQAAIQADFKIIPFHSIFKATSGEDLTL